MDSIDSTPNTLWFARICIIIISNGQQLIIVCGKSMLRVWESNNMCVKKEYISVYTNDSINCWKPKTAWVLSNVQLQRS